MPSKPTLLYVAIVFSAILVLSSCADRQQISEQQANLELAEMNGDLDGMFLALSRLDDLGVSEAEDRLPLVKEGIAAREMMRRAAADHDHEQALISADYVLTLLPDNKEALQVVRKSGQIFYYLEAAKSEISTFHDVTNPSVSPEQVDWQLAPNLSEAEVQVELNKLAQIALKDIGKYSGAIDGKIGQGTNRAIAQFSKESNLAVMDSVSEDLVRALRAAAIVEKLKKESVDQFFSNLSDAKMHIGMAKELDPNFKHAIELEKMANGALDAVVFVQAASILEAGSGLVGQAASLFESVESTMSLAVQANMSPSSVWTMVGPSVNEWRQQVAPLIDKIDTAHRRLSAYEDGDASKFVAAMSEYVLATKAAIDALTVPSGSLSDFRRSANHAAGRYSEAQNRVSAALPTSKKVDESVQSLGLAINSYKLYSNPETKELIKSKYAPETA